MDRYERINALHRILKAARYPVTVPRLQEELGCSRATVYRDLAFLRDALMAPVEGDGEAGFRYEATRRRVSPQRITHYRDNWYLDAWDHDREALRSFAVDRITQARLLDEAARDLDEAVLDQHLASSYGIFSGEPRGWATIVFSPKVARWVADEHWHSRQQGRFLPDGHYELKLPYSVPRELLMDILHYGADAEIIEPAVLREQARSLLSLALSQYD